MNNLTGLVVCGGQSSRMGLDKSLIDYHGLPHSHYLYHLLINFCDRVFLSMNELQSEIADDSYPYITDASEYCGIGPMAALLSAWQKFPDASLLVIGCDYPFVNRETIQTLLQNRKGNATCFVTDKNIYEPLMTIYESSFNSVVMKNYLQQNYSLSRILKQENANTIFSDSHMLLQNVNTIDEYHSAKKLIKRY